LLGSTLLLIEKATHDPLYLWDIRLPSSGYGLIEPNLLHP
jgi:hypothetical protein